MTESSTQRAVRYAREAAALQSRDEARAIAFSQHDDTPPVALSPLEIPGCVLALMPGSRQLLTGSRFYGWGDSRPVSARSGWGPNPNAPGWTSVGGLVVPSFTAAASESLASYALGGIVSLEALGVAPGLAFYMGGAVRITTIPALDGANVLDSQEATGLRLVAFDGKLRLYLNEAEIIDVPITASAWTWWEVQSDGTMITLRAGNEEASKQDPLGWDASGGVTMAEPQSFGGYLTGQIGAFVVASAISDTERRGLRAWAHQNLTASIPWSG